MDMCDNVLLIDHRRSSVGNFLFVFTNDRMHILQTTVTYLNVILVECTIKLVMLREVFAD